jgi:hypothetical protein
MARTLLATIRAVTGELGFNQPSQVLASQVLTDQQLKQLTIAACDELLDTHDWQYLLKRHTVNMVTGTTLYDLPADYHRIVPATTWQSARFNEAYGNMGSPNWEEQRARNLTATDSSFRLIGNKIEVYPSPTTGETLTFVYISKYYVLDGTTSLPKAEFTLDSDTTVFHDRLLTNLVKLKLLQVKNLDTRAAVEDFNTTLEQALGGDTPAPTLSTDPAGVASSRLADHQLYDLAVMQ